VPGLLRMVARTAAVAGTASAVSGRVQRHQARRWAADDPQAAAPEPAAEEQLPETSTTDVLAQLKTLGELKDQGVLTEDEFAAQKAKILAG
jgi:hypothetical protein